MWANSTPKKIYKNPIATELRSQLNEQLKALDNRVETQCALVTELQDWFRKRAELHSDYSTKLDKLARSLLARHKEHKIKRESWNLYSVYNCWQILVNQTKKDARDHAAMANVYMNNIVPRFTHVQDDLQRIYKKCREIGYESHEELLKVLHELHTTMRTYHVYQTEAKSAEAKLQNLEAQKAKLEQTTSKEKLEKRRKFKVIEKEVEKRRDKYRDAKLKALKARNEYILSMEAANSSIHKYFVEDLSDVIDCMDFGLHSCVAKALLTHAGGEECFKRTLQNGIDELKKSSTNMDSRLDKQRFLEYNNAGFMLPNKFQFQGHKGDETNKVVIPYQIQDEMVTRYEHLAARLGNLKTESEETWKTIETAEKSLLDMINVRDYDVAHYFADETRTETRTPETAVYKKKADRQETEAFYLQKFRDYTISSNLICRLQTKFELMGKALGDENRIASSPTPTKQLIEKPRRRRIGRTPVTGQPRLFGGSLEEYVEATEQEVPIIIKSCIRVINLYGLHHQGIFRVSGSQVEINNFRECFENQEDPLIGVTDASDINSVAGVLKLYLRELREPLFPTIYFDHFMIIAQLESKEEFVQNLKEVAQSLPRSVFVVMRYLFAFLNHLSEFSDENMMDPYNLAICFGPTLVPIPEDKDQVQYQNLVNELIKNIIIFWEDIFSSDGGVVYEKYISSIEGLDTDVGDSPSDDVTDDELHGQSEDDTETIEAIAQFAFKARSARELSFDKGATLTLQTQVSSDWWKGSVNGQSGLIPDKYILIKLREDERSISEKAHDESTASYISDCSYAGKEKKSPCRLEHSISHNEQFLIPDCERVTGVARSASTTTRPATAPIFVRDSPDKRLDSIEITPDRERQSTDSPSSLPSSGFHSIDSEPRISLEIKEQNSRLQEKSPNLSYDESLTPESERTEFSKSSETKFIEENKDFSVLIPQRSEHWNVETKTNQYETDISPGIVMTSFDLKKAFQRSCEDRKENRKSLQRSGSLKDKYTPDLVLDLPINSLSTSPQSQSSFESPMSPESLKKETNFYEKNEFGARRKSSDKIVSKSASPSPEVSSITAADHFAKQHQSTLKKGSRPRQRGDSGSGSSSSDAQTQTLIPKVVSTEVATETSPTQTDFSVSLLTQKEDIPSKTPTHKLDSANFPTLNLDTSAPKVDVSAKHCSHPESTFVSSSANISPTYEKTALLPAAKSKLDQRHSYPDNVSIKISPAVPDTTPAELLASPSTPKLAARYLKAVAESGGGLGIAVKPHVKIKPAVCKKPSLTQSNSSSDSEVTSFN